MPSKTALKHSTDVFVKRENWSNGYHAVARQQGRFVATKKWTGSETTEHVLNLVRKDVFSEQRTRYTYLIRAQNPDDETRNLAVFAKYRIFTGSKRRAKLDIKPIYDEANAKYRECKFKPSTFQLFRVYDGGMIL